MRFPKCNQSQRKGKLNMEVLKSRREGTLKVVSLQMSSVRMASHGAVSKRVMVSLFTDECEFFKVADHFPIYLIEYLGEITLDSCCLAMELDKADREKYLKDCRRAEMANSGIQSGYWSPNEVRETKPKRWYSFIVRILRLGF